MTYYSSTSNKHLDTGMIRGAARGCLDHLGDVVPAGLRGDVLVEIVGHLRCSMSRAVCTPDDRRLENSPYEYIPFADGLMATGCLGFSERVSVTAIDLQGGALHVYGAEIRSLRAARPGSTMEWLVEVEPTDSSGYYSVVLEVWPNVPCRDSSAICTSGATWCRTWRRPSSSRLGSLLSLGAVDQPSAGEPGDARQGLGWSCRRLLGPRRPNRRDPSGRGARMAGRPQIKWSGRGCGASRGGRSSSCR